MAEASRYTNTKGAAAYLACSASYLEKCRVAGGDPRFLKIGKAVRYKIADLENWASARGHESTAEYARGVSTAGHAEGTTNDGS